MGIQKELNRVRQPINQIEEEKPEIKAGFSLMNPTPGQLQEALEPSLLRPQEAQTDRGIVIAQQSIDDTKEFVVADENNLPPES